MTQVILFHSAQGLRPGVVAWADSLRRAGHTVWTPDLLEGATFDTLAEGVAHRDSIGMPELIRRATEALEPLPPDAVYAGFSMGAATAEYFAVTRAGALGAILMHAVAPPETLGADRWPQAVAVQVHHAVGDPWVSHDSLAWLVRSARAAGAPVEVHTYPGSGHLFADPDDPEFDAGSTGVMLERELEFLARVAGAP
jgi:dienelactone hydrolase